LIPSESICDTLNSAEQLGPRFFVGEQDATIEESGECNSTPIEGQLRVST
jgi:hypothetical protein